MNDGRATPPQLVRRLWRLCSARRRAQILLLLVLMLASAAAEVISLGAVLPFIGALTAPEAVLGNARVAALLHWLPASTDAQRLGWLTLLFVLAAIVAVTVRLMLLWFNHRFTAAFGTELAVEAYNRALHQPYVMHTRRNSSELVSLITRKVDVCINAGVLYFLFFVSSVLLIAAVTVALLLIDARVALLAGFVLGGIYFLASRQVHRRLSRNSRVVRAAQDQTVKALQEGFGGVRDVLLDGSQNVYCELYRRADHDLRQAQGLSQFLAGAPRFFMEAVGIGMIAIVAWRLSAQPGGLAAALPALAALALGAQRLLPAMQLAFNSWAVIVANAGSMADLLALLEQPIDTDREGNAGQTFEFRHDIEFRGVSFRYAAEGPDVLRDVQLRIGKGERVGVVGPSGAGKSTLIDLLLGLLEPCDGAVLVDGMNIAGPRRRDWQRILAHVPQSIFLADVSLAENIAFGVPPSRIDLGRVRDAVRQAQLEAFVAGCPDGLQTRVGERGIRLSGGQRQRIGIARALYKRAQVLVLDEATNALDDATEQDVMAALDAISRDLTVVIIAHRLTTVRGCDCVVELRDGTVQRR